MNRSELFQAVSSRAGITKAEAERIVTITLDAVIDGLVSDGKVILPGFGSFETRQHNARVVRNPRNGDEIIIPATTVAAFKPGKNMKDAVASGTQGDGSLC